MIKIKTQSEEETGKLGNAIAKCLIPQAILLLTGELGTGKTVLARGIFAGLGTDPLIVRSPSFTLINEYPSDFGNVFHIDLYRLEKSSDFSSLPLEEIFLLNTISVVEWADRLPFSVSNALQIKIWAKTKSHEFHIDPEIPGIGNATSSFSDNRCP